MPEELEVALAGGVDPRYAVNSSVVLGMSCCVIMFSTRVCTGVGWTVLMLPKDKPRRPSPGPCWNWVLRVFANSMAWFSTLKPPTVTVSVPTSPEAVEPSPYWICQVEPEEAFQVELLDESKIVWPLVLWTLAGSSVLHTHRSAFQS